MMSNNCMWKLEGKEYNGMTELFMLQHKPARYMQQWSGTGWAVIIQIITD